ncbi:hypothetical protein BC629DRAFT_1058137 [Irpex lacteus]|nr:hypothetical protein BC629DRAFT_1058137 [Irpex lacteus]
MASRGPRTRQSTMQEAISSAAIEAEETINDSGGSVANTSTKRKRGSTTTKKPPTKRSNLQPTAQLPHLDTAAPLHEVDNAPGVNSSSSSSRSYGTRTTNNPHPAKSVGLEKRRQTDIAQAAAVKKADKQAKTDAKERDQREKAIREHEGVIAVAALLDKRRGGQASDESPYGSDHGDLPGELQHQISQVALHSEDGDDLLGGELHGKYGSRDVDSGDEDSEGEMRHDVRVGGAGPKKQVLKSKPQISEKDKREQRSRALWADIDNARTPQGNKGIRPLSSTLPGAASTSL